MYISEQWYLRAPIQKDEVLSSWLIRSALDLGCSPLTLVDLLWGKWRGLTIDLDKGISADRLKILLAHSIESEQAIKKSMLESYFFSLNGRSDYKNQVVPWILVLGIRNRANISGRQACTQCLDSSEFPPYFRVQWRFGWHCGCEIHRTRLIDFCPHCGASIQIAKTNLEHGTLAVCTTCHFDLRKFINCSVNLDALNFQKKSDMVLKNRYGIYNNLLIQSEEWFGIARAWLSFIRTAMTVESNNLLNMLTSLNINLDLDVPITPLAFEFLSTKEREGLLSYLDRFMSLPCDVIVERAMEFGITHTYFWDRRKKLPEQLQIMKNQMLKPMKVLPLKGNIQLVCAPKSKKIVQRKWLRLVRAMNKESCVREFN